MWCSISQWNILNSVIFLSVFPSFVLGDLRCIRKNALFCLCPVSSCVNLLLTTWDHGPSFLSLGSSISNDRSCSSALGQFLYVFNVEPVSKKFCSWANRNVGGSLFHSFICFIPAEVLAAVVSKVEGEGEEVEVEEEERR